MLLPKVYSLLYLRTESGVVQLQNIIEDPDLRLRHIRRLPEDRADRPVESL